MSDHTVSCGAVDCESTVGAALVASDDWSTNPWGRTQNDNWYPPERHPDYQPPAVPRRPEAEEPSQGQAITPSASTPQSQARSTVTAPPVGYNTVFEVHWKGGWPGVFAGENQAKALTRSLAQLNNEGWRVSAAVTDRWSFFKRLEMALLAVVTLGFVVHHQNIILVVERIS